MNREEKKLAINEQIKRIAGYRGMTLKTMGEEYNSRYGTKYTADGFRKKINNETGLSFRDVQRCGEILGFSVNITLDEGVQLPVVPTKFPRVD